MKKYYLLITIFVFSLLLHGCGQETVSPTEQIEEVSENSDTSSEPPAPPDSMLPDTDESTSDSDNLIASEENTTSDSEESMEEATDEPVEEPFTPPDPVEDHVFVKVTDYIPDIVVDLKYATTDNFTEIKIYDFTDAYLRYGTVEKLMDIQESLKEDGYLLKIWDAFRPVSAQFVLWEAYPDPTFVANPNTGGSSHSKGNTIDVTLVDLDGDYVEMPTGFDDFSAYANRDYSDNTEEAAANALLLEDTMIEHGFEPYFGEWWHYSDSAGYNIEREFDPATLD